ncbi:glucose sorbosone dehydrogenase [Opitutaceae bacterium EW11]|nr:glucose sorbosone dehydrogenase [Opitutaceae bacterium EW11]
MAAPYSLTSIVFLFATIGLAHAQQGNGRSAPALFQDRCAGCHGQNLEGGKASSLLDQKWAHGGDDASLENTIRNGLPVSGMPAFGTVLSDAEIRALIVFIRESATRVGNPEMRGSHPLPDGPQSSEAATYRMELVSSGFDVPWSIAFLPDGRMLVTERPGRLRVVKDGAVAPEPVSGIPDVWAHDEGGLFTVLLHPDYAKNGWVYLSFADPGEKNTSMTKIIRGRLRGNAFVDQETIFNMPRESYRESGMSFGGRLVFDGRYLFFSVGERGKVGDAQQLDNPYGKIHRLHDDGRVPDDNPFVHTPGAMPSIWSFGHRNPQGLAVVPETGELWETEHGPRGGDELNFIRRGANYGWPVITHGMNYDGTPVSSLTAKVGMEQPVRHWTPSIATCPILFYTGDAFPGWKNQLFLGSLAQQEFLRFTLDGGKISHEERVFKNRGRVRDIQQGPDGCIYLALEIPGGGGLVARIVPDRKP